MSLSDRLFFFFFFFFLYKSDLKCQSGVFIITHTAFSPPAAVFLNPFCSIFILHSPHLSLYKRRKKKANETVYIPYNFSLKFFSGMCCYRKSRQQRHSENIIFVNREMYFQNLTSAATKL